MRFFRTPSFTSTIVLSLACIVTSTIFLLPTKTLAAVPNPNGLDITFTPEIPIPGLFDTKNMTVDNSTMANYIKAVFVYFIWVIGIVATFMVVYGGIRWVSAAGNAGRIKEARDIIDNAIIGVIIALCSVVLLNIINPKLTKFSLPGLASTTTQYADGLAVTSVCTMEQSDPKTANSFKVLCGQITKTGTTTDTSGNTVDAYCIGTRCEGGSGACQIHKVQVGTKEYFAPVSAGCTQTLPMQPLASSQYANTTSIDVTYYENKRESIIPECGLVLEVGGKNGVGTKCNNSGDNGCYVLGEKAIIRDELTPNADRVTNMLCPAP